MILFAKTGWIKLFIKLEHQLLGEEMYGLDQLCLIH